MTSDDIVRMAREAGATDYGCSVVLGHEALLRVMNDAYAAGQAAERKARKAAQLETVALREELTKRAMQAEKDAHQRGVHQARPWAYPPHQLKAKP